MPNSTELTCTKICCNANGPIIVEGEINLVDKYGRPLGGDRKKKMTVLCGCGQSLNKPFCDGNHNRNGATDDDES